MPSIHEIKEWQKFLAPLVTVLIGFFTAATMYIQHSDSTSADARFVQLESRISQMDSWKEKVEIKLENSTKEISTLNVQLAQVLVKIDNVIDCLKELKNAKR